MAPMHDPHARWREGLCDVGRRRHRLPRPPGEFVAPITPATAEPCCRLEEIAIARGPQRILAPGHKFNRWRDPLCQQGRLTHLDPDPTKRDRTSHHPTLPPVAQAWDRTRHWGTR